MNHSNTGPCDVPPQQIALVEKTEEVLKAGASPWLKYDLTRKEAKT